MGTENKLDQIAMLLVNYKRELTPEHLHDVLYVLPKINTFEFVSFRDGNIDIDKLKVKVMGIKEGTMMTKGDLIKAGVQPEFFKGYYKNKKAWESRTSAKRAGRVPRKLAAAASLEMPD